MIVIHETGTLTKEHLRLAAEMSRCHGKSRMTMAESGIYDAEILQQFMARMSHDAIFYDDYFYEPHPFKPPPARVNRVKTLPNRTKTLLEILSVRDKKARSPPYAHARAPALFLLPPPFFQET
jgi:hypothetical protein